MEAGGGEKGAGQKELLEPAGRHHPVEIKLRSQCPWRGNISSASCEVPQYLQVLRKSSDPTVVLVNLLASPVPALLSQVLPIM